ncbi:hypothetical protein BDQ17DRAFT_1432200 [Cyathus striatus]|nr:hypothetical protein BDQ17DRAFT_1432200 [Cyathus striatus]
MAPTTTATATTTSGAATLVQLNTPPPPSLQEATKNSTNAWQADLTDLFRHAKDRFPDVVWELVPEEEDGDRDTKEEVWGHKAIVYARAPPSFQSRYFSFRPSPVSPSPLPYSSSPTYPAGASALSLSYATSRTPSPRPGATSPTSIVTPTGSGTMLRLRSSINSALFSNELEYLYTGQGFGEAFEFLFDASEAPAMDGEEAEDVRVDKLRKDLVYMWRSRLYSDVRIALTGNFSSSLREGGDTTAIFSSHRFILVSRCPYFYDALLSWPSKPGSKRVVASMAVIPGEDDEDAPPTLTLPSPPFTPASLHFTLGFLYTGTLIFSHRTYDLSTAFAILRSSLYLSLATLHDEVQARIAQEMMHGLFHAFLPFPEYERLTGGKWGTGGCRCRQCARRAPRVLEFSMADDVKNANLERGARRALVGLFGEGWCTSEFASLAQKTRDSLLKGVGRRTLGPIIDPWAEIVKEMILNALKVIDECLAKESEVCFGGVGVEGEGERGVDEWMEMVERDGVVFDDGERVEWVMQSVLRGVKESYAPTLYQTLVSSILLRPHPTEPNSPLLSATSHIRVQVEQTRLELLKWISKRWLQIRQERGFDVPHLEGWALKEISDHIEVPIEDLLNPAPPPPGNSSSPSPGQKSNRVTKHNPTGGLLLRPVSQHPHTSRVDNDSEAGQSLRVSVVSRSMASSVTGTGVHRTLVRGTGPSMRSSTASLRSSAAPVRSSAASARSATTSVRSVARSTTSTVRTESTVGASRDSPARRIVVATRNAQKGKEREKDRPDSKFDDDEETPEDQAISEEVVDEANGKTPQLSIAEPPPYTEFDDLPTAEEDQGDKESVATSEREAEDEEHQHEAEEEDEFLETESLRSQGVPQKTMINHASTSSVASHTSNVNQLTGGVRPKPSSSSVRSHASTIRRSGITGLLHQVCIPHVTASSGTTGRTPVTARSTLSSISSTRSLSRLSTASTSTTDSSVNRSTVSSATDQSFRTASSGLSTPTRAGIRSRKTSATSTASVRTAGAGSSPLSTRRAGGPGSSPVIGRGRRLSSASASSVNSMTRSVSGSTAGTGVTSKKPDSKKTFPVPALDANKLSPASAATGAISRQASSRSIRSERSAAPGTPAGKKIVLKKSTSSLVGKEKEKEKEPVTVVQKAVEEEKENIKLEPQREPTYTANVKVQQRADVAVDHKKTGSSASTRSTASTTSTATLKKRSSTDTITKVSSVGSGKNALRTPETDRPPAAVASSSSSPGRSRISSEGIPRGATLEIGIPCIISSKRKRFKAYARYIGEVEGELGPWVGVEVPMDSWGDVEREGSYGSVSSSLAGGDDRQWNDGTWGGIRYFEIGGGGSEWEYGHSSGTLGDGRASRRRRVDVGMGTGIGNKGMLKREGEQLNMGRERTKRIRSASPTVSDVSGTESRGLFVRPQQVLYVVDAVGVDL